MQGKTHLLPWKHCGRVQRVKAFISPQIRYKGIKLSQYKNLYLKKHRQPPSVSASSPLPFSLHLPFLFFLFLCFLSSLLSFSPLSSLLSSLSSYLSLPSFLLPPLCIVRRIFECTQVIILRPCLVPRDKSLWCSETLCTNRFILLRVSLYNVSGTIPEEGPWDEKRYWYTQSLFWQFCSEMLAYICCSLYIGCVVLCLLIILTIGGSLSEPHTSMIAFVEVVCMYVCMYVCLFAAIYRKF